MRPINADALLSQVKRSREKNPYTGAMLGVLNAVYDFTHRDVLNLINYAPTIDAEPVVRCRDCEYYKPEPDGDVKMCYGFATGHWPLPDDYCSRSKRRADHEQD